MARQEAYWLDVYSGDIPRLDLPTDYERPDAREFAGDHVTVWVDAPLCLELRELSRETGATLYMVLLAIFNILLARCARQEDIVVGAPVSGRNHADLQHIIGMFVNMLPIRNRPAGHKTFREFLGEVRETTLAAFENQDFQFDQLVSKLGLPGNSGENPLCQAVFNMFTIDDGKEDGGTAPGGGGRLNISPYKYERRQTPFNLLLNARELSDSVKLIFTYSTELFKKTAIEKMADHLLEIARQVVGADDVPLTDIKISHDLLTTTPAAFRDSNSGFNF
jgi:tyrocidine synthetase-3